MKEILPKLVSKINTSRTIALVLSLLLCISIIGIIASAASVTKDGLEVTLVTDKEEYSASEPIVATLTVENKSDKTIDEVNLETLIPDGYHIESTVTATKNVGQIRVGEKAVLAVTLLPNLSPTSETPVTPGTVTPETPSKDNQVPSKSDNDTPTNEQKENLTSSTTSLTTRPDVSSSSTTSSSNSAASSTHSTTRNFGTTTTMRYTTGNKEVKSVNTGDDTNVIIWLVLGGFSLTGLIVTIKKNKGQKHIKALLSFVVSLAILFGYMGAFSLLVDAESVSSNIIEIKKTVMCEGNQLRIDSKVKYIINEEDVIETSMIKYSKPSDDHMSVDENTGMPYVDNEIIITGINIEPELFSERIKGYGGRIVGEIPSYGIFQVRFSQKKSIEEMESIVSELEETVDIEKATPNYIYPIDESYYPNDPEWEQWQYTPAGNNWGWEYIFAPQAWDYRSHVNTVIDVGVIDSGFSTDHPDLSFSEEPIANSGATLQHKWTSHGTHVAGTIGSNFNNGVGVSGVATNCRLHGFSLWGACSYGKTDLLAFKIAFFYLIVEKKCRVVNVSMGMDSLCFNADRELKAQSGHAPALNELRTLNKELESDLLKYLKTGHDFVICKAGGNQEGEGYQYFKKLDGRPIFDKEGNEAPYSYYSYSDFKDYVDNGVGNEPEQSSFDYSKYASRLLHSTYFDIETEYGNVSPDNDVLSGITNEEVSKHIICVGALELNSNTVKVAPYSQEGKRIDILAPGSNIFSTVKKDGINTYDYNSGTSMASPIVAGVAVLMLSIDPSLKGNNVKDLIVSSGRGAHGSYQTKSVDAEVAVQTVLHNKYGYIPERDSDESPGDISGIDDLEPSNPSEPTAPGDVGFASGKGTKEDPYVIMTPEQLNSVRYHLDANFVLGRDIDMSSWGNWDSIGTSPIDRDKLFTGVFDGNNNSIKNLMLGGTADQNTEHGLFGYTEGIIKNLNLDGCSVTINDVELIHAGAVENWAQHIGGISSYSRSTIENCSVSGTINVSNLTSPGIQSGAAIYVGGIAGCSASNIVNCHSSISITIENVEEDISVIVGGIVADSIDEDGTDGYLDGVRASQYMGTIKVNNISQGQIGGIAGNLLWGIIDSCSNYGNINCCITDGNYERRYNYVGGIAALGSWYYGLEEGDIVCTISNCINYADTIQNDTLPNNVGRITGVGDYWLPIVLNNNYSTKDTLINGSIPTTEIGIDKKNGANM